jgi:hypothetical protein
MNPKIGDKATTNNTLLAWDRLQIGMVATKKFLKDTSVTVVDVSDPTIAMVQIKNEDTGVIGWTYIKWLTIV